MELYLYEWSNSLGIDSAIISSKVETEKILQVHTSRSRLILLLRGDFRLNVHHSDHSYQCNVHAGDILFIPQHTLYEYLPLPGTKSVKLKAFRMRFFETTQPHYAISGNIHPHFKRTFQQFSFLQGAVSPKMRRLIKDYQDEAKGDQLGREDMLQCVSMEILVSVVRKAQDAADFSSPEPTKNVSIVEGVNRFLHEHLSESFSLHDVGWQLRLSGEHVARIYRKETGRTIFQHLKQLRMEKAAHLLTNTSRKVHEIAEETGFSSHSLFSREFRKYTGVSPEAFRAARSESVVSVHLG